MQLCRRHLFNSRHRVVLSACQSLANSLHLAMIAAAGISLTVNSPSCTRRRARCPPKGSGIVYLGDTDDPHRPSGFNMKFTKALVTLLLSTAVTSALTVEDREPHPMAGQLHNLGNVHARSCAVRDYGCEKGYCWQKCSQDGSWCWMALGRGYGDWLTCLTDAECGPDPFGMREAACSICDSSSCGCSC
ncbi:uncharacterized protein L3040_005964 [Drepanopeziza brunnea f. sp. 'multigermtubi']|uniref:uncharacterized protein n=1 Tax=Drepanopeziza brunnea f. sp. 'multigermtubi' TaxID=698441 RepID=UPI00238F6A33|nr:hypothetical protein L3040_005964 [Drepanopeziza brunnea f. sp. 'multigermtubi']